MNSFVNENQPMRPATILTNRNWNALRSVLATIILAAAGLKAHQLATMPSFGEGLLHARWFNILVVEFELFFGAWLIFGLLPRLTWLMTIGCFSVFASVSLYKAMMGESSCNCWGAIEINPKITVIFDLGVLGLLLLLRPIGMTQWKEIFQEFVGVFRQKRFVVVVSIWLLVAAPVTYAILSVQTFGISELGEAFVGADGKSTITLEPERWANNDFDITNYTDIKGKLNRGVWLVLLHTHTCSACQESVRLYQELAVEFADNETAPKIAMLELPPYETEQGRTNSDAPVIYGKLDKSHRWKIKAPAVLLVDNHKVQNVFDNPLEIDLIRAIWGNKK